MYVFDEVRRPEGDGARTPGGALGLSPWFLGQVLPRLLDAVPRLKMILAGWDRLEVDPHRLRALPPCELTGWAEQHTRAFLASAGVEDPAVAVLVQRAGDGLPLLASVVAEEAGRWRVADGSVDTTALTALIGDRPAHQWVPEMILARLSVQQQHEIAAAAVLRICTRPALQALLVDRDPATSDWFHRLTSRSFLQSLPTLTETGPGGR